jgi:hypothetical protein
MEPARITVQKPDGVKVRTAFTDNRGSFRIDALEAGVPYALAVVTVLPSFLHADGYEPYEDRIILEEGQLLSLDIGLVHELECP